jgi:hypothetical protein
MDVSNMHSKALDFFKSAEVVEEIESSYWSEHTPLTLPTENQSIMEINIPSTERTFPDLRNVRMKIVFRIQKITADGLVPLGKIDDVCFPITQALHSFWSRIDLYLNEELVSCPSSHHAYQSYFDSLFNYSKTEKQTVLDREGYLYATKDLDQLSVKNNVPQAESYATINDNKSHELFGRVRLNLNKDISPLLLDGVNMRFKFHLNRPGFIINSAMPAPPQMVVRFENITLYIKQDKPIPAFYSAIQQVVAQKNNAAMYPLDNFILKSHPIASGQNELILQDVFQQNCPPEILLGMVSSEAFQGVYNRNAMCFRTFDIEEIGSYVNDIPCPSMPLKVDFAGKKYNEAFQRILDHTRGVETGLQYNDVTRGYALFPIRLSPGNDKTLVKKGRVKIHLKFKWPLTENITVLIAAFFPSFCLIDGIRLVTP